MWAHVSEPHQEHGMVGKTQDWEAEELGSALAGLGDFD